MAWSASKIHRAALADIHGNVTAMDFDADSFKAALFNNSITPDQDATSANSAFNAGQWANTNEVSHSGQWAAGGVALTSQSLNSATAATVFFDAADTASGSAATLASVFGCLVYDDTLTTPVADQGASFHYFGGSQSVTAGTFTIVWHANGLFRYTI